MYSWTLPKNPFDDRWSTTTGTTGRPRTSSSSVNTTFSTRTPFVLWRPRTARSCVIGPLFWEKKESRLWRWKVIKWFYWLCFPFSSWIMYKRSRKSFGPQQGNRCMYVSTFYYNICNSLTYDKFFLMGCLQWYRFDFSDVTMDRTITGTTFVCSRSKNGSLN